MPVLPDERHELFAQGLASGKVPPQAYRDAGFQPTNNNSATAGAARLAAKAHVIERVREISAAAAEKAGVDATWVVEKLVENVERSMQVRPVTDENGETTGEFKYEAQAANKGLEILAKLCGQVMPVVPDEVAREISEQIQALDTLSDDELERQATRSAQITTIMLMRELQRHAAVLVQQQPETIGKLHALLSGGTGGKDTRGSKAKTIEGVSAPAEPERHPLDDFRLSLTKANAA